MSSTFESSVSFQNMDLEGVPIGEIRPGLINQVCVFKQTPSFMGTTFNDGAMFAGVKFEQAALFGHSHFVRGGTFHEITASIGVDFNNATFERNIDFSQAELGVAAFFDCQFEKSAIFEGATFGNNHTELLMEVDENDDRMQFHTDTGHGLAVDQHKARKNEFVEHYISKMWGSVALFNRSTSHGVVDMTDAIMKGHIFSHRIDFDEVDIKLKSPLKTVALSYNYSNIKSGHIHVYDSLCYIEFASATVGNVDIRTDGDISVFDHVYIDSTTFNGFEFSDYREELRDIGWKIDGAFVDEEHVPPDKRETTYSKAKAGADLLGDRLAQSEFSVLEKRYRRQKYWESRMGKSAT